jgi:hypothetical protein
VASTEYCHDVINFICRLLVSCPRESGAIVGRSQRWKVRHSDIHACEGHFLPPLGANAGAAVRPGTVGLKAMVMVRKRLSDSRTIDSVGNSVYKPVISRQIKYS